MYCGPYSARVLHSVSDQIRNLQNCFTAPNKMTSEDDIEGLVSLNFLRPWFRGNKQKKLVSVAISYSRNTANIMYKEWKVPNMQQ
jgi:hypothetical protein